MSMRRCSPKVSSILSNICPVASVNPRDRDPGLIRLWGMGGLGENWRKPGAHAQGRRAGQTHPESQDPGGAEPKVGWEILSLQEESCLCRCEHWKETEILL